MTNIELFVGLRFTDKNGHESIFVKGDNVVCCLKDGNRYKGILSFAGLYQDNDVPFEYDYQNYCGHCGQRLKWTGYSKAKLRYAGDK